MEGSISLLEVQMIYLWALLLLGGAEETPLVNYFFECRTTTGLVLDRDSRNDFVSCAATGFGMNAWAIAAQENRIDKKTAILYIQTAFETTVSRNPQKNRGWLYHFTNLDGTPKQFRRGESEVSSIDTVLFYLNAEQAARRLDAKDLSKRIAEEKVKIDVSWMMRGGYISHGFRWNGEKCEWINDIWDENSEGVLAYRFFNIPFKPKRIRYDLPLFTYFYPVCFFDDPVYVADLQKAVEYQRKNYGYWGWTACDGPDGYQSHDRKVISPIAIWGLERFVNDGDEELKRWNVSKTTCGYHVEKKWASRDRLAIDYGSCLVLRSPMPGN
jgi:hypothetical protein